MARKCVVRREAARKACCDRYREKRAKIKAAIKKAGSDPNASFEDRMALSAKLQKLPRNSSLSRQRRRCRLTGRPRGNYRRFGLCRQMIREYLCDIPGISIASW